MNLLFNGIDKKSPIRFIHDKSDDNHYIFSPLNKFNLKFMIDVAKILHDNNAILIGNFVRDWIVPRLDKNIDIFNYNNEIYDLNTLNIRYYGPFNDLIELLKNNNILMKFVNNISRYASKFEIHNMTDYSHFELIIHIGCITDNFTYINIKKFDIDTLTYHNNHLDIDDYNGSRGIDEVIMNILNKKFRVIVLFNTLDDKYKLLFIMQFIIFLKKGFTYPNITYYELLRCKYCNACEVLHINDINSYLCIKCLYDLDTFEKYLNY